MVVGSLLQDQILPSIKIGICCFSANHAALRERAKTQDQDNVFEWGDM